MLLPEDRTLLADLLAPPAGYRLIHAVATTFTLDLTALLSIPLGLAGMDLEKSADPLSVMQTIREYASRIDVFCQAGMAKIPSQHSDLLAFLERIVHQVPSRPTGIFHPKIWALRFCDDTGEERLRLTCGSRNLTFDRSWDAVISLDGVRTRRHRALNAPLADFLQSLPGRAGLADVDRSTAIGDVAEALRCAEWERPEGAASGDDWLAFHVFGQGSRRRPDVSGRRRLLISPFVEDAGLDLLWPNGEGDCTLLSREEELDCLGAAARSRFTGAGAVRVLNANAWIPEMESPDSGPRYELSGLHAKVYVFERGRSTHVLIGSANATGAAWNGNDEILVEIAGATAALGIEAMLGREDAGFGRLLLPHEFGEPEPLDLDDELRRRLERALCELAAVPFVATVDSGSSETFGLTLRSLSDVRPIPEGATLTIEPLTLRGQPRPVVEDERLCVRWDLGGVEGITPFFALRLAVEVGKQRTEASCVALARLEGDVEDRLHRVLARRLSTPEEFLRFLLLLLQMAGKDEVLALTGDGGPFGRYCAGAQGSGLLEGMVAALANSPSTIDEVGELIPHLEPTVLPEGWSDVWVNVLEARRLLGGCP
jgi:hypothetical protein